MYLAVFQLFFILPVATLKLILVWFRLSSKDTCLSAKMREDMPIKMAFGNNDCSTAYYVFA